MTQTNVPRDEVEAALLTRRELGPEYEPAIVDSLVERIDQAVAYRVQQELQLRRPAAPPPPEPEAPRPPKANAQANRSLALAIVSVVLALPLSVAAVSDSGANGWLVFVVLAFTLAINVVYTLGGRR